MVYISAERNLIKKQYIYMICTVNILHTISTHMYTMSLLTMKRDLQYVMPY